MEFLISHGANVNKGDDDRLSPLHSAAHNNNKEIAELLISHGAKIDAKTSCFEETPLHIATKNDEKETPLHFAVFKEHRKTIELLISDSADIHAKNDDGESALKIAEICE